MIRVLTNDSSSAKAIHALLGQKSARGKTNPSNSRTTPSGKVIFETEANFPRYSHQALNSKKTPPTIRPNSLSARNDFFRIIYFASQEILVLEV